MALFYLHNWPILIKKIVVYPDPSLPLLISITILVSLIFYFILVR